VLLQIQLQALVVYDIMLWQLKVDFSAVPIMNLELLPWQRIHNRIQYFNVGELFSRRFYYVVVCHELAQFVVSSDLGIFHLKTFRTPIEYTFVPDHGHALAQLDEC